MESSERLSDGIVGQPFLYVRNGMVGVFLQQIGSVLDYTPYKSITKTVLSTVYVPYIYRISTVYVPYIYRVCTVYSPSDAVHRQGD